MKHFYLIAGHGEGDPGAVGNGYEEQELARLFNRKLAKWLKKYKSKVSIYNEKRDMYKRTNRGRGLYSFRVNKRIVIETHLNASKNKKANGVETLIADGLAADKYDKAIQKSLSNYFYNRGIKKRDDLLNMYVAKIRGINYRLIELCFISNKKDVKLLIEKMDEIAKKLAQDLTKQ